MIDSSHAAIIATTPASTGTSTSASNDTSDGISDTFPSFRTVHVICGLPGSGKTTYGKTLAKNSAAIFLDIDTCTERLVQVGMTLADLDPADRDSAMFKATYRTPIYDTVFDIARENLSFCNVVIVGPFTKEIRDQEWPLRLAELLSSANCICVRVKVHYLFCNPDDRRKRLMERNNPRDAAKLQDWGLHCSYYGIESRPIFDHDFVDTSLKKGS